MLNEDALKRAVIFNEIVLVPCTDRKHQESTRVVFYHLKKKMYDRAKRETIGISKFNFEDKYFIKLYLRTIPELWTLDQNGIPTLLKLPIEESDLELREVIKRMKEDNQSEEEIERVINTWEKNKKAELLQEEDKEQSNTEIKPKLPSEIEQDKAQSPPKTKKKRNLLDEMQSSVKREEQL